MPRDWKGPFSRRLQVRASHRGQRMAAARWANDRARRAALAALTPERCQSHIVLRVVVIRGESQVAEAVIRDWDRPGEARKKLTAVLPEIGRKWNKIQRENEE